MCKTAHKKVNIKISNGLAVIIIVLTQKRRLALRAEASAKANWGKTSWGATDLEGDEDDEVGEVEAEDLAAGAGAAHHLQRGGKEGSLLGSGQGCNRSI